MILFTYICIIANVIFDTTWSFFFFFFFFFVKSVIKMNNMYIVHNIDIDLKIINWTYYHCCCLWSDWKCWNGCWLSNWLLYVLVLNSLLLCWCIWIKLLLYVIILHYNQYHYLEWSIKYMTCTIRLLSLSINKLMNVNALLSIWMKVYQCDLIVAALVILYNNNTNIK